MNFLLILFALCTIAIADPTDDDIKQPLLAYAIKQQTEFYADLLQRQNSGDIDGIRKICSENDKNKKLCSNSVVNFVELADHLKELQQLAGNEDVFEYLASPKTPRDGKIRRLLSKFKLSAEDRMSKAKDLEHSMGQLLQQLHEISHEVVSNPENSAITEASCVGERCEVESGSAGIGAGIKSSNWAGAALNALSVAARALAGTISVPLVVAGFLLALAVMLIVPYVAGIVISVPTAIAVIIQMATRGACECGCIYRTREEFAWTAANGCALASLVFLAPGSFLLHYARVGDVKSFQLGLSEPVEAFSKVVARLA